MILLLSLFISPTLFGLPHSLILKTDGSLHAFGDNSSGRLGDGTNNNRSTPTQIFASGVARLSEQPTPYAETFTVSGGQGGSPYYTFTDSLGNTPDMTNFTFHKGSKYLFTANNISPSHPFKIGSARDVNSTIVNGGTLTSAGNGHQIIVNIPHDFAGTLVYYCVNHAGMTQSMNVSSPPAPTGGTCLLYTSPSPRDATLSRMPSSA